MLPAAFSPVVWLSDIPLETLIARLTAPDPRDRALAACALRVRRSGAARAAVSTVAVEDQCPDVRKQAAWALGVLRRQDSGSQ